MNIKKLESQKRKLNINFTKIVEIIKFKVTGGLQDVNITIISFFSLLGLFGTVVQFYSNRRLIFIDNLLLWYIACLCLTIILSFFLCATTLKGRGKRFWNFILDCLGQSFIIGLLWPLWFPTHFIIFIIKSIKRTGLNPVLK